MKRSKYVALGVLVSFCMGQFGTLSAQGAETLKDKVANSQTNATTTADTETNTINYSDVYENYLNCGYMASDIEPIVIDALKGTSNLESLPVAENIGDKSQPVLDWTADTLEWAEYSFTVTEAGLYQISAEYYIPADTFDEAVRSFEIDGKSPFAEAETLNFLQMYTDSSAPKQNSYGDEISPSQVEIPAWRTMGFYDSLGLYDLPYRFYFEPGVHTIKFSYINVGMYFSQIEVAPAETIANYAAVKASYEKNGYQEAEESFTIEAESAIAYKSSAVIRMQNDSDPACTPRNDDNVVMNILKGVQWKTGNDEITWNITVPQTGLYKINMYIDQSLMDGLPVYRKIMIDGEVPFAEMLQYTFAYNKNWQSTTLSDDDGNPYLFYLTEGSHTFTMSIKLSKNCELLQSIKEDMNTLSDLLLSIKMITGDDPDLNYEYRLDSKIPNLMQELRTIYDHITDKVNIILGMSAKSSPAANAFISIQDDFSMVYENPDLIPRKLGDLEDDLETMGSWYSEFQVQPLGMDSIAFTSPNEETERVKTSFVDYMVIGVKSFVRSFIRDYSDIGTDSDSDNTELDVWIGRGKDWAQCLEDLAGDDFTNRTGIALNIHVIPAGQLSTGGMNTLLMAMAAGTEPDVALGITYNLPVEFALRGAAYDLSQCEGFSEVKERFLDGIMIAFEHDGGYYALPETMNFRCLLYRTDIIQKLGISIPDTWDDVYSHVLPILYQNNMDFFCSNDYFSMFLFQNDGSYYTEDGLYSALDTAQAYNAFKEWTELYTEQGIPVSANFYSRFRNGSMPIGIGGYTEYMSLISAAPELVGRIGMASLPGHINADGAVDRSAGGYADTAMMIFSSSIKSNEAFRFLDWWTSDEVQTLYGKSLEAVVGTESRWNSANLNAFFEMSWTDSEKKVITESLKWAREMPVILGGYYTTRHITNAWNRVVLSSENARDSLEEAVSDINRELRLRREEKQG